MSQIYVLLKVHLRQQLTWTKLIPVIIFLVLFLSLVYFPINQVAFTYHAKISYGIFALILSNNFIVSILMTSYLMLVNQLPFRNSLQAIVLTKTGSFKWLLSQLIYVVFISFLFIGMIHILSLTLLLFNIEFSNSWGAFVKSLSQGILKDQETIPIFINSQYIQATSPAIAFFKVNTILLLNCILIGWVTMVGNVIYSSLGLVISSLLLLLHLFFNIQSGIWVQFYSPISWINPYLIRFDTVSGLLSFPQVIMRLIALLIIIILVLFIYYKIRRRLRNE